MVLTNLHNNAHIFRVHVTGLPIILSIIQNIYISEQFRVHTPEPDQLIRLLAEIIFLICFRLPSNGGWALATQHGNSAGLTNHWIH